MAGSKVAESKTAVDEKVSGSSSTGEEKVQSNQETAKGSNQGSSDNSNNNNTAGFGSGSNTKPTGGGGGESKQESGRGRAHQEGNIMLPQTIKAQRIMDGFKIISMNMSNAQTGEILWQSANWEGRDFEREAAANVPKRILQCKEVAREITFYSK